MLHANELPVATTAKGDDERVMVRFHETNDLGSLPLSKILDFAEHLKEKSSGGKKTGGFAKAVAAAKKALEEDDAKNVGGGGRRASVIAVEAKQKRLKQLEQDNADNPCSDSGNDSGNDSEGHDEDDEETLRLNASRLMGNFSKNAVVNCRAAVDSRRQISKEASKEASKDITTDASIDLSDFASAMCAHTKTNNIKVAFKTASLSEHLAEVFRDVGDEAKNAIALESKCRINGRHGLVVDTDTGGDGGGEDGARGTGRARPSRAARTVEAPKVKEEKSQAENKKERAPMEREPDTSEPEIDGEQHERGTPDAETMETAALGKPPRGGAGKPKPAPKPPKEKKKEKPNERLRKPKPPTGITGSLSETRKSQLREYLLEVLAKPVLTLMDAVRVEKNAEKATGTAVMTEKNSSSDNKVSAKKCAGCGTSVHEIYRQCMGKQCSSKIPASLCVLCCHAVRGFDLKSHAWRVAMPASRINLAHESPISNFQHLKRPNDIGSSSALAVLPGVGDTERVGSSRDVSCFLPLKKRRLGLFTHTNDERADVIKSTLKAEQLLCVSCELPMGLYMGKQSESSLLESDDLREQLERFQSERKSGVIDGHTDCPWCVNLPPSSPSIRNGVWCPSVAELFDEESSGDANTPKPTRPDALSHFQWHWTRGHPVLVRDVLSYGYMSKQSEGNQWTPERLRCLFLNASADDDSENDFRKSDPMLPVTDMSRRNANNRHVAMTFHDFVRGFNDSRTFSDALGDSPMYRLANKSQTNYSSGVSNPFHSLLPSLPFQEYVNPVDSPLNVFTFDGEVGELTGELNDVSTADGDAKRKDSSSKVSLSKVWRSVSSETSVSPFFCPSLDLAYGRHDELGFGDSVGDGLWNEGHDLLDLLAYSMDSGSKHVTATSAGVQWHVFPRDANNSLQSFLDHRGSTLAHRPLRFLTGGDLDLLKQDSYGQTTPWEFTQSENEAVLVPAGSYRQTRNLKSVTRVSSKFFSPESFGSGLGLTDAETLAEVETFVRALEIRKVAELDSTQRKKLKSDVLRAADITHAAVRAARHALARRR